MERHSAQRPRGEVIHISTAPHKRKSTKKKTPTTTTIYASLRHEMNIQDAAVLKSNMHTVFDSPQGKEVMKFLEINCCWYQSIFVPASPDLTLINDGKRQVIATIKTILECNPEQIAALAQKIED